MRRSVLPRWPNLLPNKPRCVYIETLTGVSCRRRRTHHHHGPQLEEAKKASAANPEKKKKKEAKAPAPVFVNKTPKGEKKGNIAIQHCVTATRY